MVDGPRDSIQHIVVAAQQTTSHGTGTRNGSNNQLIPNALKYQDSSATEHKGVDSSKYKQVSFSSAQQHEL